MPYAPLSVRTNEERLRQIAGVPRLSKWGFRLRTFFFELGSIRCFEAAEMARIVWTAILSVQDGTVVIVDPTWTTLYDLQPEDSLTCVGAVFCGFFEHSAAIFIPPSSRLTALILPSRNFGPAPKKDLWHFG